MVSVTLSCVAISVIGEKSVETATLPLSSMATENGARAVPEVPSVGSTKNANCVGGLSS